MEWSCVFKGTVLLLQARNAAVCLIKATVFLFRDRMQSCVERDSFAITYMKYTGSRVFNGNVEQLPEWKAVVCLKGRCCYYRLKMHLKGQLPA